jgi:hypothetical protein
VDGSIACVTQTCQTGGRNGKRVENVRGQSERNQPANVIWCAVRKPARTPSAPREDASSKWTMSAARRRPTSPVRQRRRFAAATATEATHGPRRPDERDARTWLASHRQVEHDRNHLIVWNLKGRLRDARKSANTGRLTGELLGVQQLNLRIRQKRRRTLGFRYSRKLTGSYLVDSEAYLVEAAGSRT